MNCINIKTKEFQKLLEATKLPSLLLEMRVAKWQETNGLDKFPTVDELQQPNEVNTTLKAVDILQSDKAKQVFEKGNKAKWDLNKILTELQIPKEQKQLILDLGITDREQIALELASNYSYTVEINITLEEVNEIKAIYDGNNYIVTIVEPTGPDINDFIISTDKVKMSPSEFNKFEKELGFKIPIKSIKTSSYYSNLTVPGGTNYTENEIATPLITPSIKGHAQFATDNGIGWHRADDRIIDIKKMLDSGLIKQVPC